MLKIRNSARAVIIRDDALLLQVCHIGDRLVHVLPGGTQEFGEPLDATVRREVLEETGWPVRVDGLLYLCDFIERDHRPVQGDGEHALHAIFRCTPETDTPIAPPTVPDTDQIDIRWVPLAALPTIEMIPYVVKQLLIAWHEHGTPLTPAYLGSRA
jgi:ADP-ribose pyrophosphatase YjhB (NUDIX family)